MSRQLQFLWIDDDPDRVEHYRALIEFPGGVTRKKANLCVHSVARRDSATVPDAVAEIAAIHPKPDLIIIDQVFSAAGGTLMKEGSSVATILREQWTDVPIVGVSAALDQQAKRKHFHRLKTAEYIDLFDWSDLPQHIPELYVISSNFKRLVASALGDTSTILTLLKCPKSDVDLLTSILPTEFKQKPDPSTPHSLARWILHTLLEEPGFLYDGPHVANLLGLTPAGFRKVQSLFTGALYTGAFASENRPRWWSEQIRGRLFELLKGSESNLPWVTGRGLPGLSKTDYSKCYVSGDDFPEILAAVDLKNPVLYPVRLRYTVPHPEATTMPGFDEQRIIKST